MYCSQGGTISKRMGNTDLSQFKFCKKFAALCLTQQNLVPTPVRGFVGDLLNIELLREMQSKHQCLFLYEVFFDFRKWDIHHRKKKFLKQFAVQMATRDLARW